MQTLKEPIKRYPFHRCMSANFSLGFTTTLILFIIYSLIITGLIKEIWRVDVEVEMHNGKTKIKYISPLWTIIQASIGFCTQNFNDWPLIGWI